MRILVVGAGIAGLTFVRAMQCVRRSLVCAGHSIDITIVERSPAFRDGMGIVLHPNGLHIIDVLGLANDITPLTNIIDAIRITRDNSDLTIEMREVWEAGKLTRTIQRKDLHTLLARDIVDPDGIPVKIKMGYSLESLAQDGDEVMARFDNGDISTYDLVVGADGVHSKVRAALFPGTPAISTNLLYFRFIAENRFGLDHRIWRTFEREEGAYGFIPLAKNHLHCFVQFRTTDPCPEGEADAYFRRSFLPWDPILAEAFNMRSGPLHASLAYMVPPGNWNRGDCVLLGDATHAVSPTLSEGGSLAMEDALVLALAMGVSADIPSAIQMYRSARQERCMRVYRMSLAQLNSLRRRRAGPGSAGIGTDAAILTRVMTSMYKTLLEDPLPRHLRQFPGQFTNLQTK